MSRGVSRPRGGADRRSWGRVALRGDLQILSRLDHGDAVEVFVLCEQEPKSTHKILVSRKLPDEAVADLIAYTVDGWREANRPESVVPTS